MKEKTGISSLSKYFCNFCNFLFNLKMFSKQMLINAYKCSYAAGCRLINIISFSTKTTISFIKIRKYDTFLVQGVFFCPRALAFRNCFILRCLFFSLFCCLGKWVDGSLFWFFILFDLQKNFHVLVFALLYLLA